jgi:S1-C subfamily serine protease
MGKKKLQKTREQRVLERVRRATVGVALSKREGSQISLTLEGTGFFISDPPGMILTARHVLDSIDRKMADDEAKWAGYRLGVLTYQPGDGTQFDLSFTPVVQGARSPEHDVAALRIGEQPVPPTCLQLGYNLEPQEGVMAGTCGWPHGLQIGPASTFLMGPISGVLPVPGAPAAARTGYILQMPVTQGNSGGPVFILSTGVVFGVVEAKISANEYVTGLTKAQSIRFARGVAKGAADGEE